MPVVDGYKGYSIYQEREPNIYRVLDGKETFVAVEDASGREVFRLTAYYNQRLLLSIDDKEAKLRQMLRPAIDEIRRKIDAGDLKDSYIHVGVRLRSGSPSPL